MLTNYKNQLKDENVAKFSYSATKNSPSKNLL